MKKQIGVVAIALALIITACGKEGEKVGSNNGGASNGGSAGGASNQSGAYGSWDFPKITDQASGIIFDFKINISQDRLSLLVNCMSNDGARVTASVSARANVTDTIIETTEDANKTEKVGTASCSASIKREKMAYKVNGNLLTLTKDGENITLNRSK